MNYVLSDINRTGLFPFTHTRAVADIRCGIFTMRERWERILGATTHTLTEAYLQPLYGAVPSGGSIYINGAIAATADIAAAIIKLQPGEQLVSGETFIAAHVDNGLSSSESLLQTANTLATRSYPGDMVCVTHIWDIFSLNDKLIRADHELITNGRKSAPIPEGVSVRGTEHIFIEDSASINPGVILNATTGPIYVGKDAEIMEGCMLRGPVALCDHATLKMGAKVYGATTIGPGCKAGGEISNVVFFANSNKGHDGFVGNAVIGEWCNLGADTNCSNLKNNYDEVKVWDEQSEQLVKTGLTFCGLLMGDHSKCGINTMFNTGTVVGVSSNIYGGNFPEKFVPSFSWGGSEGMVTYQFDRAMETADRMMARRGKKLSDAERKMYGYLFGEATRNRP